MQGNGVKSDNEQWYKHAAKLAETGHMTELTSAN
jgi:hypothetical protein